MAEERRLVTILFADVVGSTAMGEALDPEDVRALLARLFAIATEAVERHGGRVEKFIGDAIMAVFGLPIAHEDDAARAIYAAIELRDRVRADPKLGDTVPIRLGVNGGEVIASREEDARTFLVTGDAVNVAARLQQAADAWSILVGERTVRAVGGRFSFGPIRDVEAKGKTAPVVARELQGVSGTRSWRRKSRIVGRQADLDQLELVARRTFEERRPFLVSVVAPAGVGKSRLLEEFLDRLDPGVRIATAQCLPYGQRLTYWPMRSILLSIVGLGDDSTPEQVRTELAAWLRTANEPDPERTAELLAATIGASEIEGDRIAMFSAWRRLVELAAELAPLVLVIEDLHWSSDSLLDLVETILQPRADVPLVMIALARPELLDRRPGWGGGRRNAITIALEPLPSHAVADMVRDLLEAPAQDIVDAVVARAEGNPFYAGEIVRSLVDRLGPIPDPPAVEGAIAALPDTVHGTVLARLDALEPTTRRIVQLGAVLGRTFESRAIQAVDPELPSAAVAAAVEDLLDRDLVRAASRGAVTFRHILIREVAYHTLPRAERARIHGAAGRWLDAEAGRTGREDELAELVAFHLREAVQLGSLLGEPVSPDLKRLAVTWLRRAAEAAASGAASVEAARHLNAAIELAEHEELPGLYERLGQIWNSGDQSAEAFERAYDLGRELGLGLDHELRLLGQAMTIRGRWVGSISHQLSGAELDRRYAEVERLVAATADDRARVHGLLALAFRLMSTNDRPSDADLATSARWARQALAGARKLDQPELISSALDASSVAPLGDDQMTTVLELIRERYEIADRVSVGERTDSMIVEAWAEAIRGKLDIAEAAADRARSGLSEGQASSWVLGATAWRILALHALGRWDEAIVEGGRAERAWQESELYAPGFAMNGFLSLFAIARARGDAVGAGHWREVIERIYHRIDAALRTRPIDHFLNDDFAGLIGLVENFRSSTPRLDYVYLALAHLADYSPSVTTDGLDRLISYATERELALVSSQALRLRGLSRRDESDLVGALADFERMGARPFVARAHAELGLLRGDDALVERGLQELEAIGDIDQAGRVAARRRSRVRATN
jgi:class 3 adenylate cyclase